VPKQAVRTEKAPLPGGAYSQAVRAGDFLFVAGMGPWDPKTRQVVGATIEEQTARTLENLRAVLEAGGADMADVVKTTVHLSDLAEFAAFNQAYSRFFPDPKPVRTTVGSQLSGFRVEIDAVAYLGA
jgi:reactive intermediate/imine deaminase